MPKEVIDDLKFVFVENVKEVFEVALKEAKPIGRTAKQS